MLDALFAHLPAPKHLFAVQLAVKVDQSRVEPLEHAADLIELEQEIIDLARDVLDAAAQSELVGRLAPFGAGLSGHEFILGHEIAPLRMERDQIGDDPLYEREGTICFGEAKVFARHGTNLDAQTHERLDAQTQQTHRGEQMSAIR